MRPLLLKFRDKYGREALPSVMGLREEKVRKYLDEKIEQTLPRLPAEQQAEFEARAREAHTKQDLDKIIREFLDVGGHSLERSYMILSWGHHKHIYIRCNEATTRTIMRGLELADFAGIDINDTLAPFLEKWAASLKDIQK